MILIALFHVSGVTEHSTSLLVEDFNSSHEGVYHFAVMTDGVINHTVYKLVALKNVPVPAPLVMFIGYEFHVRALFTVQPDQIYWYRIDAGVMLRLERIWWSELRTLILLFFFP